MLPILLISTEDEQLLHISNVQYKFILPSFLSLLLLSLSLLSLLLLLVVLSLLKMTNEMKLN